MIAATAKTIVSFPELGLGPWNLNRFLVEDLFGKISIAWYGVIICLAMVCACFVILYNATKREGFLTDSFLDYFLFTIPLGIVGARVMYVLARPDLYDSFSEAVAIWNGGLAIYGGVLTGIIVIPIIAKIKKQNVLKVFDAVVPGLLLAQAMGRWGNFINGEAYGEAVKTDLPWGMVVNGTGPVHPTFLYESIITFTGFLIAMFLLYRFKKFDGEIFVFYLIWYGIGRTLVESIRSDSLMIGSLRLAQCIGIASALAGAALMIILMLFDKTRPDTVGVTHSGEEDTELTAEVVETVAEEGALPQEEGGEKEEKEEENGTDH